MDNLETFPEGAQALDFAASNGVHPEVPHILWEGLLRAGFVVRWLEAIRSRIYIDDVHLDGMDFNIANGRDLAQSEELLVRRLYMTCERILTHPDIEEDITTEHLTHIAGLWMASGVLTVTWESIILSSAEEVFGEKLTAFDVNEVALVFKSAEPMKRLGILREYFLERMSYPSAPVERFLQILLRRITPFL